MKKKYYILRLIFLIVLLISISVSCAYDFSETHREDKVDPICQTNMDIKLSDLLINTDDLPPGWYLGKVGIGIDEDRSYDSVGSHYYPVDYQDQFPRLIDQMIYRHKKEAKAEQDFSYGLTLVLSNTEIPTSWNFNSEIADESGIICRDNYCTWEARYDCIVLDMVGRAIPGYSTFEDFEQIVRLVDKKFGELMD